MRFIHLGTHLIPLDRIEKLDRAATIEGSSNPGIEIFLFDVPEGFTYTGLVASDAFDDLVGVEAVPAPPTTPLVSVLVNGVPTPVASVQLMDGSRIDQTIVIGDQTIDTNDILWADFEANIKGQTGVELALRCDEPGMTRQYTGEAASEAYDVLAPLAENRRQYDVRSQNRQGRY